MRRPRSRVALVAVWVLPTAKSPYPLEEQSTLLMPFECLNASWPSRVRGPKLLVDMGMRVTAPGGLDKMMELYVAANLSKYLYTWDPIGKRSTDDSGSRLNSFGCGPDTPLSEGTACLETYRVQLPPDLKWASTSLWTYICMWTSRKTRTHLRLVSR